MRKSTHSIDFTRPQIMGVLNVTPDSFYDGGRCFTSGQLQLDAVLRRAEEMLAQGADIIDVGGESTRPGATPVTRQEECDRVLPVVEAISERLDILISVDTSCPGVMSGSAVLGASLINDVRALQAPGALEAAASSGMMVCLMHMQGGPQSMQLNPSYDDAFTEVYRFLQSRKDACIEAGIRSAKIILDPGIGFGKKDEHNLELLKRLDGFCSLGPILLGVSRKSMFERLLGRELNQRLAGSLAVAVIAMSKGVKIIRVHDVAETCDARKMFELIGA